MGKLGTITFKGKSGNEYSFNVYPFNTDFKAIGAVYFVTQRTEKSDGTGSHTRIYVGETGDLSERFDNHHKQDCFDKHNANCICVHSESNEKTRLEKESDLIDNYNPPCNG